MQEPAASCDAAGSLRLLLIVKRGRPGYPAGLWTSGELEQTAGLSMQSLACLNGKMMPVDEARVPVMDRGFLFGDSVYEVMRIYGGRCWQEETHHGRLKRSLAAMEYQPVDLERLKGQIHQTIKESGVKEGTVYIQVTRGVAPRRHAFPDPPVPPTELVVVRPYDDAARGEDADFGSGGDQPSRPEVEAV